MRRGNVVRPGPEPIGPKVQAHIHEDDYEFISQEVAARGGERGVESAVIREVIALGVARMRRRTGVSR